MPMPAFFYNGKKVEYRADMTDEEILAHMRMERLSRIMESPEVVDTPPESEIHIKENKVEEDKSALDSTKMGSSREPEKVPQEKSKKKPVSLRPRHPVIPRSLPEILRVLTDVPMRAEHICDALKLDSEDHASRSRAMKILEDHLSNKKTTVKRDHVWLVDKKTGERRQSTALWAYYIPAKSTSVKTKSSKSPSVVNSSQASLFH